MKAAGFMYYIIYKQEGGNFLKLTQTYGTRGLEERIHYYIYQALRDWLSPVFHESQACSLVYLPNKTCKNK